MSRLSRRRVWMVVVPLLLLAAAAGVYWCGLPPSPSSVLSAARRARSGLAAIAFDLRSPWPAANTSMSGLAGARSLLGPTEGERLWRVAWLSGSGMRAEVVEPADLSGTLAVVTADRQWLYSPLLGIAVSTVLTGGGPSEPVLVIDQLLTLAAAGTEPVQVSPGEVAGRPTWSLQSAAAEPAGGRLQVDFDRQSGLPVAGRVWDAAGRLLGALEIGNVNLSPALRPEDFLFDPPAGVRVLPATGVQTMADTAAAATVLDFVPVVPAYVPAGMQLLTVNILGQGQTAALVLGYGPPPGGSAATGLLSLTQTIAGADYRQLTLGTPVSVAGQPGRQFELGELRGIDWRAGNLSLTIFGSVSAAELARVAASVR